MKEKIVLISARYSDKSEKVQVEYVPLTNSEKYTGYYNLSVEQLKELENRLCYAGDDALVLPKGFKIMPDGSAVEYVTMENLFDTIYNNSDNQPEPDMTNLKHRTLAETLSSENE